MTETVKFAVMGEPIQWKRTRATVRWGKPLIFKSKEQIAASNAIGYHAIHAMKNRRRFRGPVMIDVTFCFGWPKSWSEDRRRAPGAHLKTSPGDVDNYLKLVMDACNQVVWEDDRQVAEVICRKIYGVTPATRVIITADYEGEP